MAPKRPPSPPRSRIDYFGWLPPWVPRPTATVWAIAILALLETVFLSYVQWHNFLSFLPTQGDLGDYNQAFYTTTHGQGVFYYTTNIPGGSGGTIFAVHFSPFLLLLVPIYAAIPGPMTLIVLKQLALCFGVLPAYGLAKVYFRKPLVPLMFAGLYLLSPATVATDWNSFDPEAFFPILLLCALYFYARGRFGPFVVFWILAMSTIEAASGLMMLFAVGGLAGAFLPEWFSQMVSPYWTAVQQRRPLLFAFLLAAGFLAAAFVALQLIGRGGGFGDAYAARFTVLGANSLPNVVVRAVTDPGAAGAALQFQGSQKATFVVLLLAGTGVVSIFGGLRYLLPILGYLSLALLSNNAAFYLFGTEYDALITGFLFAGSIEGAARISLYLHQTDANTAHQRLGARLRADARRVIAQVRAVPSAPLGSNPAVVHLRSAIGDLRQDQLGSAEHRLVRVHRELERDPLFGGSRRPVRRLAPDPIVPTEPGIGGRLRRRGYLPTREDRGATVAFALVVVIGLAASAVASPLGTSPVAASLQVQAGNPTPTAHEKALATVLKMIPKDASVLTTSHLFPQLSNRPNAFVVPDHAFLPVPENYSYDVNNWVHKADYVAVDYVVDPQNTMMLMTDADLTGFGLYASDGGAVVYARHWVANPALWVPWTMSLPPNTWKVKYGAIVNQSGGPAYYHPSGGPTHSLLWDVPNAPYLPLGSYKVTFAFALTAGKSGTQLNFSVTENPGVVRDLVALTIHGRSYHIATFHPLSNATGGQPTVTLQSGSLNTSTAVAHLTGTNRTMFFTVSQPGYIDFPGIEISKSMSVYLFSITITQLKGT